MRNTLFLLSALAAVALFASVLGGIVPTIDTDQTVAAFALEAPPGFALTTPANFGSPEMITLKETPLEIVSIERGYTLPRSVVTPANGIRSSTPLSLSEASAYRMGGATLVARFGCKTPA